MRDVFRHFPSTPDATHPAVCAAHPSIAALAAAVDQASGAELLSAFHTRYVDAGLGSPHLQELVTDFARAETHHRIHILSHLSAKTVSVPLDCLSLYFLCSVRVCRHVAALGVGARVLRALLGCTDRAPCRGGAGVPRSGDAVARRAVCHAVGWMDRICSSLDASQHAGVSRSVLLILCCC